MTKPFLAARIPEDLHGALIQACESSGQTKTEFIVAAIQNHVAGASPVSNLTLSNSAIAATNPEQIRASIEAVKNLIAPKASDEDLHLFAQVCSRTGLDPFQKEIYAIHRWDARLGAEKMSIQVGIDGLRKLAAATGQYAGSEIRWCGPDGLWREVWLENTPPSAAKASIYRKGCGDRPFEAVARWASYCQVGKNGSPSGLWAKMPDTMLAKCAEALALRKAFPDGNMSGLYTPEEMDQATAPLPPTEAKPWYGQCRAELLKACTATGTSPQAAMTKARGWNFPADSKEWSEAQWAAITSWVEQPQYVEEPEEPEELPEVYEARVADEASVEDTW